jgi:Tfp pilus assembly protein PilX
MRAYRHTQKGFTLFLAVVMIAIVVTIGLSLAIITHKEITLANTRRESQIAYYAAQSATECALFGLIEELSAGSVTNIDLECNTIHLDFVYTASPQTIPNPANPADERSFTFGSAGVT